MRPIRRDRRHRLVIGVQRGFTLIEAVMVIVITGIIASMVAVFIRAPIEGYVASERRAQLTDTADTAARRIARDLRLALPNSVRVTGSNQVLEFLSTRTGGRYRIAKDVAGDDVLDFSQADTTFDVVGPSVTRAPGDQIVVFNLGIPGADAYAGDNRTDFASSSAATITIASKQFPFDSPAHRFQVVDTPVSYLCDLTAGTLKRYSGYTITSVQPNPPTGGSSALLAQNVSNCVFTYTPAVTARTGLVSIQLSITQNGETVSLYHAVHVSNVP